MKSFIEKLSLAQLFIGSVLSIGFHIWATEVLNTFYAQSRFPVPYYVAQTCFDTIQLQYWYKELILGGTMNIYYHTQYFDFVFILSVISMGFLAWNLVAYLFPTNSWFRKNRFVLSIFLPLAGFFDILENLISFIMLAQASSFPTWLTYVYCGFASLKFFFWTIAFMILGLLVLFLLLEYTVKRWWNLAKFI